MEQYIVHKAYNTAKRFTTEKYTKKLKTTRQLTHEKEQSRTKETPKSAKKKCFCGVWVSLVCGQINVRHNTNSKLVNV